MIYPNMKIYADLNNVSVQAWYKALKEWRLIKLEAFGTSKPMFIKRDDLITKSHECILAHIERKEKKAR